MHVVTSQPDRTKEKDVYVCILLLVVEDRKIYTIRVSITQRGGVIQYGKPSAVTCHIYWLYTYCVYAISDALFALATQYA